MRLAYLFDPVLEVHTSIVEPLPHQITQGSPFDVFRNYELALLHLPDLENCDDIRMVEQRRRPGLSAKPRKPVAIHREILRQHLERDLAAKLSVDRKIDDSHTSFRKSLADKIFAELFADPWIRRDLLRNLSRWTFERYVCVWDGLGLMAGRVGVGLVPKE